MADQSSTANEPKPGGTQGVPEVIRDSSDLPVDVEGSLRMLMYRFCTLRDELDRTIKELGELGHAVIREKQKR